MEKGLADTHYVIGMRFVSENEYIETKALDVVIPEK